MKRQVSIVVFIASLLTYIVSAEWGNESIAILSKSLIIPSLMVLFLDLTKVANALLSKLIFAALFFSWVGDILLLFQDKDAIFFLLGLASFLIAHLFYCAFLYKIFKTEQLTIILLLLLIVVIYYSILIFFLFPYLGEMKLPVIIYGLVISTMLMLAMHMKQLKNKNAGTLLLLGAVFFVLSDSFLALNKFYNPFALANVLIMLTYGLAQLFLVLGAADLLTKQNIINSNL